MQNEETNSQNKEQYRVVINREANQALEAFANKLNEDSGATKISKSDLANYVFQNLSDFLTDADVTEIRAIYFDAKKALEGILKGGKDLPEHLREALLKHCGIKSSTKEKRTKKLSTPKLVESAS